MLIHMREWGDDLKRGVGDRGILLYVFVKSNVEIHVDISS